METKQRKVSSQPVKKPRTVPSSAGKSGTGSTKDRAKAASVRRTQKSRQRSQQQTVKATADVVYLPPKPFSRNRLILHLATVVAVVLALILGLSIFFKVDASKITVSGAVKYSAWDVAQASQIQDGANLLTFNRAAAAWKIRSALPYVKDVRIGIKLPDTVNIEIVEVEVTYSVRSGDSWWLVSSDGRVIEEATDGAQDKHTKILGVQLSGPKVGAQATALQEAQTATDAEGNLIPVTVTAAEQLSTALDIAGFLERNGIIGETASIDVNDLGSIQLWYGKQYQVELGDSKDLLLKITYLKSALDQYLKTHDSGILDITDPPKVVYMSF